MNKPLNRHQRELRAAYRDGWQVRISYYERLLRNILVMLEDAQDMIIKVDDMPDVMESLGKVLMELENAWGMVAARRAETLSSLAEPTVPDRSGDNNLDGHHNRHPFHVPTGAQEAAEHEGAQPSQVAQA